MPGALRKPAEIGRTHAERRREAETRIVQAAFGVRTPDLGGLAQGASHGSLRGLLQGRLAALQRR